MGILSKLFLCIILLWNSPVFAQTRAWTDEEKIWASSYVLASYVDYRTTSNMIGRPGYYETNLILGRHPSQARLNIHFLTLVPLVLLGADYFEADRKKILIICTMTEIVAGAHNLSIGLRFTF